MSYRPFLVILALSGLLTACADPYDPGQRAYGGALLGAGSGAALGAIAGGGRGAAIGALIGGGLGAIGGAASTPESGYDGYTVSGPVYSAPQPVYQVPQSYYGQSIYGYGAPAYAQPYSSGPISILPWPTYDDD